MTSETLHVDASLIDKLPITDACEIEVATPPDLLPSTALEPALKGQASAYKDSLVGRLRQGLHLTTPETIAARKTSGGTRPVPLLTFDERVVLRAIGIRIELQLPEDIPSSTTYREMLDGPREASAEWVAHGDVAAFFAFVDHGLLADEIVALTGDYFAASALVDLLRVVMGRGFGLPQGHRSSDIFASIYLDAAERRLIRSGRRLWRYSDDFRIAASSHVDSLRAIDELDEELRRIGLALNDDKTFTHSAGAYEAWVAAAENAVADLASEVRQDLTDWNPYTDEPVEPGDETVWSEAASRALTQWSAKNLSAQNGPERLANRRVISLALSILGTYGRTEGLGACKRILQWEPQLTPHVSRYMGTLLDDLLIDDTTPAKKVLAGVVSSDDVYLNDWQTLWLLEAVKQSWSPPDSVHRWVKSTFEDAASATLKTSAAVALSAADRLTTDALLNLFDQTPKASRAELLAALGRRSNELTKSQERTMRRDFVEGCIFDFYQRPRFDPTEEPF